LIARTQGGDELRHRRVTLQSTEAFDGFKDARGDRATRGLSFITVASVRSSDRKTGTVAVAASVDSAGHRMRHAAAAVH
jgi:hypothetical protein